MRVRRRGWWVVGVIIIWGRSRIGMLWIFRLALLLRMILIILFIAIVVSFYLSFYT